MCFTTLSTLQLYKERFSDVIPGLAVSGTKNWLLTNGQIFLLPSAIFRIVLKNGSQSVISSLSHKAVLSPSPNGGGRGDGRMDIF